MSSRFGHRIQMARSSCVPNFRQSLLQLYALDHCKYEIGKQAFLVFQYLFSQIQTFTRGCCVCALAGGVFSRALFFQLQQTNAVPAVLRSAPNRST